MTRSNKKANHGDHVDRLSDLPSHVIDLILCHLPIQDVVRTSILSRKWRYMWTSVSRLGFGYEFFEKLGHVKTPRIITEVLLLHSGPVHEFTLKIPIFYPVRIRCLSKWIMFLSRNGIKDLELEYGHNEPYQMPSHLFACQELATLVLRKFKLSLPPNFRGFKSLIELHLYHIRFESNALESLIFGCPLLDVLTLSFCSGFGYIDVSAASVTDLYIEGDQVIKTISFQKATNLIHLTLLGDKPGENFENDRISNLIKGLPKIESLCLGEGYIKIPPGTIPQTLGISINSLKYLELESVDFNVSGELLFIICLLKSFPNLAELVIKSHSKGWGPVPDHLKELECNSYCLSQLKTVNIDVDTYYKLALELIRFLLANSSSLVILTFKVGLGLNPPDTPQPLSIAQDLLLMERASQKAKVKFLYDGRWPH